MLNCLKNSKYLGVTIIPRRNVVFTNCTSNYFRINTYIFDKLKHENKKFKLDVKNTKRT